MPVSPNKLLNNDHGNYVYATYTGHIFDTTLDIYFCEARFYDASTRTWLAMDPIKDGGNWYQYCASNPLRYWDPLGTSPSSVFVKVGCGDTSTVAARLFAFSALALGVVATVEYIPAMAASFGGVIAEAIYAIPVVLGGVIAEAIYAVPAVLGGIISVIPPVAIGVGIVAVVVAGGVILYRSGIIGDIIYKAKELSDSVISFFNPKSNSISRISLDLLPDNVKDSYEKYKQNGWSGRRSDQTAGTKAGGRYRNLDGQLPAVDVQGNDITYREFDVNNKIDGQTRDSERFVVGSDGTVYYTNNHYGSFEKVEDE